MSGAKALVTRRRHPASMPAGVLSRLREAGLFPRRGLGQHFLCDPAILASIVEAAAIEETDAVLEVGTGPGTLTSLLCERARLVVSVEIDGAMATFARGELDDRANLRLIHDDALAGREALSPRVMAELEGSSRWKLVANLPYAIATPLVLHCFTALRRFSLAVVTVQREVAERLGAAPGERAYGPPTLLLGYWASVEPIRDLPPGAFLPPPRVSSRVIRIQPRPRPLSGEADFEAFAHWVRRLFGQRRKQIGGLLRRDLGEISALEALKWMQAGGRERAGDLPAEAFLALARTAPPGGPGSDRERCRKGENNFDREDSSH